MTTNNTQSRMHFCIYDYYLDGTFLKSEEVLSECPILAVGQQLTVDLEEGKQVQGEIVETVSISENEHRILLRSL